MDDNDWDLYAVVRGCSATATAAAAVLDPFSSFPPPLPVAKEETQGGGKDEIFGFPDLMGTSTSRYELEELCKPFYITPHQQPLQQRQLQPLLVLPKPTYPSSSLAASVFPAVSTVPYQFQQRPRQPHRPASQTPRSKRRKNQQKKVVCQVPADGVSSDMWAWRKYGQKPIKGSPYPRGYYRCSSSKGCQARKQVERSRAELGMLVITYTAEHNHPVPAHRNTLSGSTRQKLPPPNSAAKPPPASGFGGDGEQLLSPGSHPSSSPLSSPAAAPRLSPTTPLVDSVENELFQRRPPRPVKGDGEEEDEAEEEDEEELLTVGDVEMMGEDEMLFLGMEVIDGSTTTAGAPKSPAKVSISSGFFEADGSFEDHFFRSPHGWLTTTQRRQLVASDDSS